MADRKPVRKTAEDLAASEQAQQRGAEAPEAVPTKQAPASETTGGQVHIGQTHGGLSPADDDTIEGDLSLAGEFDTEVVSGDDPLASIDLTGGDAAGFDVGGLDLSQELAELEAPNSPKPGGDEPPALNAATAVKNSAAGKADVAALVTATVIEPSKPGKEGPAAVAAEAGAPQADAAERLPRKSWRERILMRSVPAWMISMMLHVALLMTLAAIQLEPVREAMGVLLTANAGEDAGSTLEAELDVRGPDLEEPVASSDLEQTLSPSAPTDFASQEIELPQSTNLAAAVSNMSVNVADVGSAVEGILPSSALNAVSGRMSSSLSGRLSGAMKSEMLERFGGNAASEKSVAMALKWLSDHQDRSGGWTFVYSHVCRGQCKEDGDLSQSPNAATALALLPFLGAGQTHLEGNYKGTVHNGLKFLISRMKVTGGATPMGSWFEPRPEGGEMYSHGLASIAICEAYAMTRDPDLLQPAQLALNFIVYAQDPRGGGWRYKPKERGDTSVAGWQLMALKSGAMGNLVVPPETFRKASSFLDSMAVNDGAFYGYDQPSSQTKPTMTAVGLLCRMYMGWSKDHPGLQEGVKLLSSRGPSMDDLYYSYYATQVLRQYGGAEWTKWNTAMRDGLIKTQEKEGHAAGSWFSPKGHNLKGGRLYCTAMSAMILEVYYRHMPLYSEKSSDDDFEL